jgi:hypothetical protein
MAVTWAIGDPARGPYPELNSIASDWDHLPDYDAIVSAIKDSIHVFIVDGAGNSNLRPFMAAACRAIISAVAKEWLLHAKQAGKPHQPLSTNIDDRDLDQWMRRMGIGSPVGSRLSTYPRSFTDIFRTGRRKTFGETTITAADFNRLRKLAQEILEGGNMNPATYDVPLVQSIFDGTLPEGWVLISGQ